MKTYTHLAQLRLVQTTPQILERKKVALTGQHLWPLVTAIRRVLPHLAFISKWKTSSVPVVIVFLMSQLSAARLCASDPMIPFLSPSHGCELSPVEWSAVWICCPAASVPLSSLRHSPYIWRSHTHLCPQQYTMFTPVLYCYLNLVMIAGYLLILSPVCDYVEGFG